MIGNFYSVDIEKPWEVIPFTSMAKFASILFILLSLFSCGEASKSRKAVEQKVQQVQGFQIGPNWSRPSVDEAIREIVDSGKKQLIEQNAKSMIRIEVPGNIVGSGFLVGFFGDDAIIATNYHVVQQLREKPEMCSLKFETNKDGSLKQKIFFYFNELNLRAVCMGTIALWPEIDLALLLIDDLPKENPIRQLPPIKFNSGLLAKKESKLLTMGFGAFKNEDFNLTVNADEDCKLISPEGVYKKLTYQKNGVETSVYSMATGCDVSPGDSGSPLIDSDSGKLVGIVWGTKNKRPDWIETPEATDRANEEEIWHYFSYAVPLAVIQERINAALGDSELNEQSKEYLRAISVK